MDSLSKLVMHAIVYECEGSCVYICHDGTELVHVLELMSPHDLVLDIRWQSLVDKRRLLDPNEHPQEFDYTKFYGRSPEEVYEEQQRIDDWVNHPEFVAIVARHS